MASENPQSETRNPQSECPAAEDLQRFLTSELSESELERIAAHLDACEACRQRVDASPELAAWGDDVRWATLQREKTPVDVSVPLARLNELLTDYEVLAEIGRGGMGIVYQARQRKLNRMVALKVLPALLGVVRPDAIKRFRREAELAAGLKHTNIIAVHDFGEIDGTLFYAMELIEGRSLRDILREIEESGAIDVVIGAAPPAAVSSQPSGAGQKAEMPSLAASSPTPGSRRPTSPAVTRIGSSGGTDRAYYRRVAAWFADVAEALHYAHEQGVIHRDIKPANLLLGVDSRIMISDFGLARASGVQTVTVSRSLLGTCRYMSPEQVDETRGSVDRSVDVYALGATLYELLAFRPMFAARDDREVLNQVLNNEPTPPHRVIRQVPRELETICLTAVEKDRARRYASAKAVADDLRRWLLDLPIHAKRPSLPSRAKKFVRRRKLPVAAAAAMTVLLIATSLSYVGYRGWRQEAVASQLLAQDHAVQLGISEAQKELDNGRFEAGLARVEALLDRHPEEAQLHIARARLLQQLGRSDEAIATLGEFLARVPDCWTAHFLLSLLYRDEGRTDKAAYHAQQAERGMPADSTRALFLRATAARNPQQAVELLDEALELDPTDVGSVLLRLRMHNKLQQYDQMLVGAERAAAMRPLWSITHGYRGIALVAVERNEDAIRVFGRAIELAPDDPVWWTGRAVAECKLGRFAEALADANRAIELDPQYGRAYSCRGRARAEMGKRCEGLADCARAIELDPQGVDNYLERLWLHKLAEVWEDVIADSTRVIELAPNDPRGYGHRAEAYARTSRYAQAISDYTRTIELNPNAIVSIHDRGTCYLRSEQFEKAIGDYTRAIQLDPEYSQSYLDRAQAYWHTGRRQEAIADLTRAVELSVDLREALYLRAQAYTRMGWLAEAIADLTRAAEMEPPDAVALLRRAMAYELDGSPEHAVADYEHAESLGGLPGVYATLWKYILLRQEGQAEAAAEVLAFRKRDEEGGPWPARLFDFLRGGISAEELRAAAMTDDERCEAHYYIGSKALFDGQTARAQDAFTKCVATNRPRVLESDFARVRLKQLEGSDTQPVPGGSD